MTGVQTCALPICAYILEDSDKETPDGIIIASGSEVNLAVAAKA